MRTAANRHALAAVFLLSEVIRRSGCAVGRVRVNIRLHPRIFLFRRLDTDSLLSELISELEFVGQSFLDLTLCAFGERGERGGDGEGKVLLL